MLRLGRHCRGVAALAGLALSAAGCVHGGHHGHPVILPPPPGDVPTELNKVMLPEYVIEPPDVLRIEAIIREPVYVPGQQPDPAKPGSGKVQTDEKTGKKIFSTDPATFRSPALSPVSGDYSVRPDGTVYFGAYGVVPVAGLTVSQAAAAVRAALLDRVNADSGGIDPDAFVLVLDVTAYNSKRVYVVFDGGGQGEQSTALPVTGSDTVFDAITTVGGLPPQASKRNIWVARRTPHPGQPGQILPVDWVGITQHGVTTTNYQLMPGDRIYVKADRLVTLDNTLARVLAPVERVFGITLLGASTVNQVQGRGLGFGGN